LRHILRHTRAGFAAIGRCSRSDCVCCGGGCGWCVGIPHSRSRCQFLVFFIFPRDCGCYALTSPDIETIWPGLSRRVASAEVQVRSHPVVHRICVGSKRRLCITGSAFSPSCKCEPRTMLLIKAACSIINRVRPAARARVANGSFVSSGFCGNWFADFVDTKQPLYPSSDCEKDVRGGVRMPWCTCMVGKGGC
jgi:hypothetical protein